MTRHDAWTDAEISVLYALVNETTWLMTALARLPRRTPNAIKVKMTNLRREAGIPNFHNGPRACSEYRAHQAATYAGSQNLALAIEREFAR